MKHPNAQIEELLGKLVSSKLAAIDLSLGRIEALLARMGSPQDRLPPVVHVAGTNGKGSLVAYLTAIFEAAGYRVHRYISPHLVRFNERIMLAGRDIEDDYLLKLLTSVAAHTKDVPVTYFEATTAAAFQAFAETPGDILLLETGLGGRLDATNVVKAPHATAITPVSMDHMDYLGNSLTGIAAEKAGIIKSGAPCIVGPQEEEVADVIARAAGRLGAPLYRHGGEWGVEDEASGFRYRSGVRNTLFPLPGLTGHHQLANAGTAIACIDKLTGFSITDAHIGQGITHAVWPARLQRLDHGSLAGLMPQGSELWLDGGHNPGAGEVLAKWMRGQALPLHVVCGMLTTKDTKSFLKPMAPYLQSLTAISIENESQSRGQEEIIAAATDAGIKDTMAGQANDFKSIIEAIAKKEKNDFIILICGSLSLAGNILWQNSQNPQKAPVPLMVL